MSKKTIIFYVVISIIVIALLISFMNRITLPWSVGKQKEYVNNLVSKGLYAQAVNEYNRLLNSGRLSNRECANLSYLIGGVYMENLRDYENALASYLRVQVLDPNTNLKEELNLKIVECLERTGKFYEAQKEMDKLTLLKQPKEIPEGTIVAKIGNRNITMEELENQIKNLPPYLQQEYKSNDKKFEFLRQYIATELLYDAAKRRNFENDKEIIDQAFQIKKSLMVSKLMQEEMKDKVQPTESEINLYYETHKSDLVDKSGKDKKGKPKTLDEAKEQITQTLRSEKERQVQQELINKLFHAEKTVLNEELFKSK